MKKMSDNKQTIIDAIKEGLKESVMDAFWFSGEVDEKINVEYLITVNIAKKIGGKNKAEGCPYKINLEEKTKYFCKSALPLYKVEKIEGKKCSNITPRKNKNLNTDRNGKIDIAIYEENSNGCYSCEGKRPLCPIEVKGFRPTKQQVLPDLERNIEFLNKQGNTGNSVIEFAVFVCMDFRKINKAKHKEESLEKAKKKYNKYIKECHLSNDIGYETDVFTVSDLLIKGSETQDEWEHIINYAHHFMGVIIVFERCSTSQDLHLDSQETATLQEIK